MTNKYEVLLQPLDTELLVWEQFTCNVFTGMRDSNTTNLPKSIPICMGYKASREQLLLVYNGSMSALLSSLVSLINTVPLLRLMEHLLLGKMAPLADQNMLQTVLKWPRISRGSMKRYILKTIVAFWHLGKFNNISIILYIDSRLICMQILQRGRARFITKLF